MKLIIAIIQPTKLEAVKEALSQVEVFRLTVMDVQGFGRQKGYTEVYRGWWHWSRIPGGTGRTPSVLRFNMHAQIEYDKGNAETATYRRWPPRNVIKAGGNGHSALASAVAVALA